jgi:hypothetical protein
VAVMQPIAEWLKKLGMSEYAERFAENRIDLSVLPDLTDQHLEKLGVALGDRLKILRAIRELSATTVAAQPAPSAAPIVQDSAERRQTLHGGHAFAMITRLAQPRSGIVTGVLKVFADPEIAKPLYPVLVVDRKVLLFLLRRSLI